MAPLTWATPEEHRYESGVSHGVFYPHGGSGVAWNGLVSVDESSDGGEATPLYLDGVKYADIVQSTNYQATVTAFSAPAEFATADGKKTAVTGFTLTRQNKARFNFSYRTKVDEDHYKIHLVYNVLANPTARSYLTVGDKLAPTALSWEFNTVPEKVPGVRPTAHLVIDSRRATPEKLLVAEQIMYGTPSSSPFLLPATTLAIIFGEGA